MKTPIWEDNSPSKNGSSFLMQCDGFWITLHQTGYPEGYSLTCKQLGIQDHVIKNSNLDDAKLIALQYIDEIITTINRAAKRLKLAEQAQAAVVFPS